MQAFVRLLGEGTDVWRPVEVELVANWSEGLYRIVGQEPAHESWECKPGWHVHLEERKFSGSPAKVTVPLDDYDYYVGFLNGLAGLIDDAEMCGYDADGIAQLREASEFFWSEYRTRR